MGKIETVSEWAEDGTKETPSALKISEGWVPNEQPPIEWENFIRNNRDLKLNEVIRDLNFSKGEPPTKTIAEYLSRRLAVAKDMHRMYSAKNVYTASDNITCSCPGYSYTLNQYTLFAGVNGVYDKIYEFYNDYATGEIECIEHDLNLPSGATTEPIIALVCDGSYLYVGTRNIDDTPDTAWIYKYAINPWDGTGIPADYCEMASGYILAGNKSMCLATTAKLGLIGYGNFGDDLIATITLSTMTVDGYGKGNESDATNTSYNGIVSDGTNLYFTSEKTATNHETRFCAAKITSRGVPDATGLAAPIEIDDTRFDAYSPKGLVCEGSSVWLMNPGLDGAAGIIGLFLYDIDSDEFSDYGPLFLNSLNTQSDADDTSNAQLVFDGKRLWIQGIINGGKNYTRFVAPFALEPSPFSVSTDFDFTTQYHIDSIAGETLKSYFIEYVDDCIWFADDNKQLKRLPSASRGY